MDGVNLKFENFKTCISKISYDGTEFLVRVEGSSWREEDNFSRIFKMKVDNGRIVIDSDSSFDVHYAIALSVVVYMFPEIKKNLMLFVSGMNHLTDLILSLMVKQFGVGVEETLDMVKFKRIIREHLYSDSFPIDIVDAYSRKYEVDRDKIDYLLKIMDDKWKFVNEVIIPNLNGWKKL